MKLFIKYSVLIISILLGLFAGIIDALMDYFLFYPDQGFWSLLILDPPSHEIYIRSVILLIFIAFGIILQKNLLRLKTQMKSLEENRGVLEIISNNIKDVIWIGSSDWNEVYFVSKSFEDIWGIPSEQLKSNPRLWMERVIEEDQKIITDSLSVIINEKPSSFDFPLYRIRQSNGQINWMKASGKFIPGFTPGEKLVVGLVQDVSAYIESGILLQKEKEYVQMLLDVAGVILVTLDEKGRITLMNKKGLEILGYEERELIGKSWFEKCIPKDERKEVKEVFGKIINGNIGPVKYHENKVLTKNGSIRIIAWQNTILKNAAGEITGTLSSGQDISQEKEAGQKLKEYSEKLKDLVKARTKELEERNKKLQESQTALTYLLEDVNEARRELFEVNKKLEASNLELEAFSYSVSHDLKAPLRAIDGFSQILLEDYRNVISSEGMRYLNIVRENTQRMGTLIQDLLDYSRVGRTKLELEPVDFNILVNAICKEFQAIPSYSETSVKIDDLPVIIADKTLIRQVWQNLMSNAFKFSSVKPKPAIHIGYMEENNTLRFFVSDNGVGFDMKYSGKLFQVFQRLHNIGEFEGTGVGLAIVKRIVQRHGGEVSVNSIKDDGADFYFTLKKS
ncbi:MAG: PAS domain S-box protein [Bacteroidetes bacterium]|nr:PAS domain S-box protein [Bacteroidota bacterium]